MTIKEIIQKLSDTNLYTVIGATEMTNKESRDYLLGIENQDEKMNVIKNGDHLLIWSK